MFSFPSSGGVLHRVTRFQTSPTSPKLNVSLTPPEGANQSPVLTIQPARTSPPVRPSSGGSPTQGYSPSRRRCKGSSSHVLTHHPLEGNVESICVYVGWCDMLLCSAVAPAVVSQVNHHLHLLKYLCDILCSVVAPAVVKSITIFISSSIFVKSCAVLSHLLLSSQPHLLFLQLCHSIIK